MSDYFFSQFYKDVKDPSWPPAENYTDFLNLPAHIQQECRDLHQINDRMSEIQTRSYWHPRLSQANVFVKGSVVYVPVFKCASSYYSHLVQEQGWDAGNLWSMDLDKMHAFGLLMHPFTRRLKGIVENLSRAFLDDYAAAEQYITQSPGIDFFKHISITDAHSMPYSISYGTKMHQVHWIPMDLLSDSEIKQEVRRFCLQHGVEIEISDNPSRRNHSPPDKIKLYQTVTDIFKNWCTPGDLYLLFADDLKFYHELARKYR